MAGRRETRELKLKIDAENNADKEFDSLADSAEKSTKSLARTDTGLKKLDRSIAETESQIKRLKKEVRESGDFELFKDIDKQTKNLNRQLRQRKLLTREDGEEAAEEVSTGFAARIGPLLARVPMPVAAPILAAAAGAAPALVSIIGGAVTLGVGAGVVGAGIAVAAKDPQVQGAAKVLGAQIGGWLAEDIGSEFVPEVRSAMTFVRSEFRSLRPEMRRIGQEGARLVEPFTRGLAGGARELASGIADAVSEAEPLADLAEEHIPALASTLSGVLRDLASNAETSAQTIDSALTFLEGSLFVTGKTLQALGFVQKWFGGLGQVFGDMVDSEDAQQTQEWADGFGDLADRIEEAGEKTKTTRPLLRGLAEDIAHTDQVMRSVHDANISAAEASLRYADAVKTAKDAADGHKKVTAEEETALLGLARSANDTTAALERSGSTTAQLSARTATARRDFINAATAMGYTKERAAALADQYLDIPPEVKTTAKLNKQQAERDLAGLNNSINNATRTRTVVVKFKQIGGLGAIGQIGMSEGGPVVGPGVKGVDSLARVLAPGEHVLTDEEVDAAGGHREVEKLRATLRGGRGVPMVNRRAVAPQASSGGAGWYGPANPVGLFGPTVGRSFASFMTDMIIAAGGDPDVLRFGRGRAGVR